MNQHFEARCTVLANELEDRMHRYISSPLEWDLALPLWWPFIVLMLTGRFPWELEQGL